MCGDKLQRELGQKMVMENKHNRPTDLVTIHFWGNLSIKFSPSNFKSKTHRGTACCALGQAQWLSLIKANDHAALTTSSLFMVNKFYHCYPLFFTITIT